MNWTPADSLSADAEEPEELLEGPSSAAAPATALLPGAEEQQPQAAALLDAPDSGQPPPLLLPPGDEAAPDNLFSIVDRWLAAPDPKAEAGELPPPSEKRAADPALAVLAVAALALDALRGLAEALGAGRVQKERRAGGPGSSSSAAGSAPRFSPPPGAPRQSSSSRIPRFFGPWKGEASGRGGVAPRASQLRPPPAPPAENNKPPRAPAQIDRFQGALRRTVRRFLAGGDKE